MGETAGSYNRPGLHWVDVPAFPNSPGKENDVAYDGLYFYIYNDDQSLWLRTAVSIDWANETTTTTTLA